MVSHQTYFFLACSFGFLMAWGVGANDVANAMGTSVGSKAITIRQAILIATIFEFCGAYFAGGEVTSTIHSGILYLPLVADQPDLLIIGMLSSLLAAGFWLLAATKFGWPVSTTHTIIGAIIGFSIMKFGPQSIQWNQIMYIVISWFLSPAIGGILAYTLFMSMQKLIFNTKNPLQQAKKIAPFYIFFASWVVAMVTLAQGLKHIGINLQFWQSALTAVLISSIITAIGIFSLRFIKRDVQAELDFSFASVEKIFALLMLFTACAMAFAHGSNDVANAIGPMATIMHIIETGGVDANNPSIPPWTLLLGAFGIVAGLVTYGHKVIATVGQKITELTPSRGFAATLSAACTVVISSGTGLPVSTTHTLVGAILGVGLARGIGALDLNIIRNILMSWLITLPAGAIFSMIIFKVLTMLLL